jgi:hypothetical protein
MNEFAPYLKLNGCFIVRNVTPDRQKTIKIFNYPINFNTTRDLLQIPGVSESDIRASLLKGELNHKIRAGDILIECSDIDLIQFNNAQKTFLQNAGVNIGLDATAVGAGLTADQHKTLKQLIHLADGVGGPMEGFTSGAYRETIPNGSPFPTSITWWTSSSKLKKIVEKNIVWDIYNNPIVISWKMYDNDGVTLLAIVTDSIIYNGPFEVSRNRIIT